MGEGQAENQVPDEAALPHGMTAVAPDPYRNQNIRVELHPGAGEREARYRKGGLFL